MSNCILLVTKQDGFCGHLTAIMQQAFLQHRVVCVRDFENAKNYIRTEGEYKDQAENPSPVLILIDQASYQEDCYDIVTRLHKDPQTSPIPIVLILAKRSADLVREAYDHGVTACISQPLDSYALAEVVNRVVLPPDASLRMIVIDDRADDRYMAIRSLRKAFPAATLREVGTLDELNAVLNEGAFDVVITDYFLTWSDGLSVLRTVKALYPGVPVIMHTITGSEKVAMDAMRYGVDDYVLKTSEYQEHLSEAVRAVLGRSWQRASLRKSEEQYRNLINNATIGIYRTTPSGDILMANPALVEMLKYDSFEDLSSHRISDADFDSTYSRADFMEAIHEQGSIRDKMGIWKAKDDSVVYVRENARAIRNAAGDVLFYEGFVQDITELHQAELAQERQERLYRALVEQSADGIMLLQEGWTVTFFSPSAERITGWGMKDLDETPLQEILHPDDLESAYVLFNSGIRKPGMIITSAYRFRHKKGHYIWLEFTASNLMEVEEIKAIVVNFRDITARLENEATLRLQSMALEAAANGILITNPQMEVLWANPAFLEMIQKTEEDLYHMNLRSYLNFYSLPQPAFAEMYETLSTGNSWRGEIKHQTADGSLLALQVTITPVRNQLAEITHFVAIHQDITATIRRQHELETLTELSMSLRQSEKLETMMRASLEVLMRRMDINGGSIILADPETDQIRIAVAVGEAQPMQGVILSPDTLFTSKVMRSEKPVVLNNLPAEIEKKYPEYTQNTEFLACFPLIARSQSMGVLWLGRGQKEGKKSHPFDEGEVELLGTIADMLANSLQRARLYTQTEERLRKLDALRVIDEAISSTMDLQISLNILLDQVTTQLGVPAALVFLNNPHTNLLEFAAGRGFRTTGMSKLSLHFGEGLAGRALLDNRIVTVNNLGAVDVRMMNQDFVFAENFVSYAAAPLVAKGQVQGVLEVFHREALNFSSDWLNFLQTLANQAAIAIDNATLFTDLQRSNTDLLMAYNATIEGWSRALDLRDKETEGHTRRVTELMMRLAQRMGMSNEEQVHIYRGALLHDIGKMGVPDQILLKPGALDAEEWEIMRKHPVFAYEMLAPIAYLQPALDIPYCHHEKWDGSGYPRGLKGEQIPLSARLFAVIDVWDALRSDRPYRQAWSEERAREYIREQSGKHFDPKVVDVFLRMIDDK